MTFTYAYLDLPPLPDSVVAAAWASLEHNKNNHAVKVNNWLDRPGYAEYEYRNFTLKDGSEVKTIKSHRYSISAEFDAWYGSILIKILIRVAWRYMMTTVRSLRRMWTSVGTIPSCTSWPQVATM